MNSTAKNIFMGFITNMDVKRVENKINFTGYKSTFSRKLDCAIHNPRAASQSELLDSLVGFCNKKIKNDRRLGSGYFSTVYKIDDKYVLKMSKRTQKPNLIKIVLNKTQKFKTLKRYFGESVAKVVNKYGADLHILRNVYSKGNPVPAGVPSDFIKHNSYFKCLDYYSNVYLPMFSSLPQRSFDAIAKDCAELNRLSKGKRAYVFDYLNPNNFVLCGKTLRIVDEIGHASLKGIKNSVADLLSVFVNNADLDFFVEAEPIIVNPRRILTRKIILAGARHGLSMCGSETNYGTWVYPISILNTNLSESMMIDMAKTIDTIVKENKSPKKRVALVSEYLDKVAGF